MRFEIPRRYQVMPLTADDVAFFRAIYGIVLKKEHWEEGLPYGLNIKRDEYKNRIKSYLQAEQNDCCAYCGIDLEAFDNPHRDHIAPKSLYPHFIFRPDNIILACPRCNGLNKKKDKDTINQPASSRYRSCEFKIIHPYHDDPDRHLTYLAQSEGILVQHITDKGRQTIELFELDSVYFTQTRAQCVANNFHPLSPECIRLKDEFLRSRAI